MRRGSEPQGEHRSYPGDERHTSSAPCQPQRAARLDRACSVTRPEVNHTLAIYNVNVFQWVALLLMALIFVPVRQQPRPRRSARLAGARVPRLVSVVRDEVVYSVMGEGRGKRFAPYFLFLFFFVCFMNTVGLLPSFHGVWRSTPPPARRTSPVHWR